MDVSVLFVWDRVGLVGWVENPTKQKTTGNKPCNTAAPLSKGDVIFSRLRCKTENKTAWCGIIDDLRQAFIEVKLRHPFEIIAVCVLPDHLHLLMRLPPNDSNYPMRLRLIKSGFSRGIPKTETVSVSRQRKNERGIWQRRYWEHEIRHQQDLNTHIDYIHINPVKHGYVKRVRDWQYSSFYRSFYRYVQKGILPLDWAGGDMDGDFGEP